MKQLLAGPFLGEFGWELFCWQGRLRKMSREFDRTYVFCRPGHEVLYEDFATVNECPTEGVSEGYLRHKLHIVPPNTKLVWYDHQWTDEQVRASGFRSDQEFVQYGDPDGRKRTGVVIHARARTLGADRNWPAERWHELGRRLVRAGVLVTWIGRSGQSVQPAAGEGYSSHDKSLRLLVPLLNDSIIVGSSSGPMHLATLCGCPQVVLTGECNRARYERHWNPLRTPVHIVPGGWQPSVDAVFESVMSLWSGSVALAG